MTKHEAFTCTLKAGFGLDFDLGVERRRTLVTVDCGEPLLATCSLFTFNGARS